MATLWHSGNRENNTKPREVKPIPPTPPPRRKRTPGLSQKKNKLKYSPPLTPESTFGSLPRPSLPSTPVPIPDILRLDTPKKPKSDKDMKAHFIASLPLAEPPIWEKDDQAVKDVVHRYLKRAPYDGRPYTPFNRRYCNCCRDINEHNRKKQGLPPGYFPLPPVRPYAGAEPSLFKAMVDGDLSKAPPGYIPVPNSPHVDRNRTLPALVSPRHGYETSDMFLYGPVKGPQLPSNSKHLPAIPKPKKQYVTHGNQPQLFYAAAGDGPIGMDPESTELAQSVVEASARYLNSMNKLRGYAYHTI